MGRADFAQRIDLGVEIRGVLYCDKLGCTLHFLQKLGVARPKDGAFVDGIQRCELLWPPDDYRRPFIHVSARAGLSVFVNGGANGSDNPMTLEPIYYQPDVLNGRPIRQNCRNLLVLNLHDLPTVHIQFKELA
jgi:hypothetical protein